MGRPFWFFFQFSKRDVLQTLKCTVTFWPSPPIKGVVIYMPQNHPSQQVVTLIKKPLFLNSKNLSKESRNTLGYLILPRNSVDIGAGAPLSKRNAGVSVLGCAIAMVAVGGCAQVHHRGFNKKQGLEWRTHKLWVGSLFKMKDCSYSNMYISIWFIEKKVRQHENPRFLWEEKKPTVFRRSLSGHRSALCSLGRWHGTQSIHEGRSVHVWSRGQEICAVGSLSYPNSIHVWQKKCIKKNIHPWKLTART